MGSSKVKTAPLPDEEQTPGVPTVLCALGSYGRDSGFGTGSLRLNRH